MRFHRNDIAYADDRITIIGLLVDFDTPNDEIKSRIAEVSDTCRCLLDQATKDVGCGINAKKSEIVVPAAYADATLMLKSDFVWLGYSFHFSDDLFLQLTTSKMNQRFESSRRMILDIFQYVHSPIIRRRIYQVHISPIVDWFLPVVMTGPTHELAKANKCASFQYDILSMVIGVCRNCSAADLHEQLAVKPANFKLREMAFRLSDFIFRDQTKIYLGGQTSSPGVTMNLRSGTVKSVIPWSGAEKRDLGDRIYILASEFEEMDTSIKEKYNKKSDKRQTFDVNKAAAWARRVNSAIQNRMKPS